MTNKTQAGIWLVICMLSAGCSEQDRASMQATPQQAVTQKLPTTTSLASRLDSQPLLACQLSYQITADTVKQQAANQQLPPGVPKIELAEKSVFMRDCLALPRTLQKCLVDQYAFQHLNACQLARREYDQKRATRKGL